MPSRPSPLLASAAGLLLGIALLLGLGCRWLRRTPGLPALVVLEAAPESWEGLDPLLGRGFMTLLKDALEVGYGLPVVPAQDLLGKAPREAARCRIRASRTPSGFRVEATLLTPGKADRTWQSSGPPRPLFQGLLAPFGPPGPWLDALVPEEGPDFLELLEGTGWDSDQELPDRQARARGLVRRCPQSAGAWLALAGLEHRNLVLASNAEPGGQELCQEHFDRALGLLPHYPRAAHQVSIYQTDIGNQRGALALLEGAVRAYPRVAHLRSAVAYAARTAGLLDLALESVAFRDKLLGGSKNGPSVAENVYLYRSDLARFEYSLGSPSPDRPEPVLDFYRGYLRLLQRRPAEALAEFERTLAHRGIKVLFETLARVYAEGLQGRPAEARRLLDDLRDQRLRLRVPDGEFTFKIAEAYGFLGLDAEALVVAERAFSQGFGCARWYEDSPFLKGLHSTPRWQALRQHLTERQALLESHFPAQRFR